jgi:hypothetical protein
MAEGMSFSMAEIESFPNDDNNENCFLVKKLMIKMIESSNPPVLFRSPEFLQNIDVYYVDRISSFLIVMNLEPIGPWLDDLVTYAEFIVTMKNWQHDGSYLFHRSQRHFPLFCLFMNEEGTVHLVSKVNECDPSFFNQD